MTKIIASVALVAVIVASAFTTWKQAEIMRSASNVPSPSIAASVETNSVIDSVSVAAAAASPASKIITWQTNNYPVGRGVDINLIRKVSDSPISFEFVRKIVASTANDGSEPWTPAQGETGSDMYIEVTCASSPTTAAGCQSSSKPASAN